MPPQANFDDVVIIGIKGTVLAISAETGQEMWRTHLKGAYFTNVSHQGDRVFAGTRGEMFCLDAYTGQLLWHNPLKGMGFGLITIGDAAQAPPEAQSQYDDAQSHAAASHGGAA